MGQVNNTGIELTLNSVNIKQNHLTWNTSFTFGKIEQISSSLWKDLDGDGKEDDDIANSLFIGKL